MEGLGRKPSAFPQAWCDCPGRFRGIRPDLANTASGKAYAGAVRCGHFYVYVVLGKKGSLRSWSDRRPFEAYAVEGYLLKGKLTRGGYLPGLGQGDRALCQRLQDCKAAERKKRLSLATPLHWSVSGDQMKAFEVAEEWSTRWQVELASDILERIAKQDLPGFWRSQRRRVRRWIRSSDRRQEQTSAAKIQHSTAKPIDMQFSLKQDGSGPAGFKAKLSLGMRFSGNFRGVNQR